VRLCGSTLIPSLTIDRLERLVRDASANKEYEKIRKTVEQLCHDYAYAVHQPHARNGGLIGLAAVSIALGSVSECNIAEPSADQVTG
jgi:hypothetical protein